jgi:hypothetical protein
MATTTARETTMSNTKTIKIATYPDGTRQTISRFKLGYEWKNGCYSSHMDNAIWSAERDGAIVTTEANPLYRKPAAPTALDIFNGFLA